MKTVLATAIATIALTLALSASGSDLYPDQDDELHLSGGTMTGEIIAPQSNDASTPEFALGDGDTGLYESADDNLIFSVGGAGRFTMQSTRIYSNIGGVGMMNEVTSSSNPTLVLDAVGDQDTGIGKAGADALSLITGAEEAVRLTEASGEVQQTWDACTFTNLGTPSDGTFCYCSDCTIAATCAGSGTGAFAKRLNSVWVCN